MWPEVSWNGLSVNIAETKGTGMSKAKNRTQRSTITGFVYNSLWFLAAIGAIAYITHLAMDNHAPSHKTLVTTPPVEDIQSYSELKSIKSSIGRISHQMKQLNAKYYLLEEKIETVSMKTEVIDRKTSDQGKKISTIDDRIGLVTGALAKAETNNKKTPQIKSADKAGKPKPPAIADKPAIQKPFVELAADALKEKTPGPTRITPKEKPLITRQNPQIEEEITTEDIVQKLAARKMAMKTGDIPMPIRLKRTNNPQPEILKTSFAVTLGAFSNLTEMKAAWGQLRAKHPQALSTLKPRYVTIVVDNAPRYQLVSGPLNNALDAARICYQLQLAKRYCKQSLYLGSDL